MTIQFGFSFDMSRCSGCMACIVACMDQNDLPGDGSRFRHVTRIETGAYPSAEIHFASLACMQCGEAPCMKVCPHAGACQKARERGCGSGAGPLVYRVPSLRHGLSLRSTSVPRGRNHAEMRLLRGQNHPWPGACVCAHMSDQSIGVRTDGATERGEGQGGFGSDHFSCPAKSDAR